jgi:transcription antitermination factor NusA-like protein
VAPTHQHVRDVLARELPELADGTIVVRGLGVHQSEGITTIRLAVSSTVHAHPDWVCGGRDGALRVLAALGPDVAFEVMEWSGSLPRDVAVALAPVAVARVVLLDGAVHAVVADEELASCRETPARVAACQARVELAAQILGVRVYLHARSASLDPATAAFRSSG